MPIIFSCGLLFSVCHHNCVWVCAHVCVCDMHYPLSGSYFLLCVVLKVMKRIAQEEQLLRCGTFPPLHSSLFLSSLFLLLSSRSLSLSHQFSPSFLFIILSSLCLPSSSLFLPPPLLPSIPNFSSLLSSLFLTNPLPPFSLSLLTLPPLLSFFFSPLFSFYIPLPLLFLPPPLHCSISSNSSLLFSSSFLLFLLHSSLFLFIMFPLPPFLSISTSSALSPDRFLLLSSFFPLLSLPPPFHSVSSLFH